jgi:hypothetical protein
MVLLSNPSVNNFSSHRRSNTIFWLAIEEYFYYFTFYWWSFFIRQQYVGPYVFVSFLRNILMACKFRECYKTQRSSTRPHAEGYRRRILNGSIIIVFSWKGKFGSLCSLHARWDSVTSTILVKYFLHIWSIVSVYTLLALQIEYLS